MFYDTYVELSKQKGLSPSGAADAIGINRATVTNWKKNGSKPSGDILDKVSKFFNVTVDYLLTGEQKKAPSEEGATLSDEESAVIQAYRESQEVRQAIDAVVKLKES